MNCQSGPESLVDDFGSFRFLLGATDGAGLFSPDDCLLGQGTRRETAE